jgi:hypothetical protein
VAVENDYNLLVFWVNNIAEAADKLRRDVQVRLLQETRDGLKPNETRWVELLTTHLRSSLGLPRNSNTKRTASYTVDQARPSSTLSRLRPPTSPAIRPAQPVSSGIN